MEVELARVHGPVDHRGRVRCRVGSNKAINLATVQTIQPNRPSNIDPLYRLTERNTPHSEPNLSRKEEIF